jgi:hypothetical protein
MRCGLMNLGRRTLRLRSGQAAESGCPHIVLLGSGLFAGFAVERRQDAIFQHSRFCFHPVLQG